MGAVWVGAHPCMMVCCCTVSGAVCPAGHATGQAWVLQSVYCSGVCVLASMVGDMVGTQAMLLRHSPEESHCLQ